MGTNTGIGIGIGIPFKNNALGGDRPYLPPELKAKLIGVWDNYGKKNTDADRNIIKNKIPNAGGDLEILNAAYEGMSGYNGYPVVFGANKTWKYKAPSGDSGYICTINDNKYNFTQIYIVNAWAYSYIKQNGELTDYNKDVTSFKIKVTGLEPDKFLIKYNYLSSTDATVISNIVISSDGIYELPKSFANDGSLIDNYVWVGFCFAKRSTDIPDTITGVNVTIEVLPEYEGAFVTDGVNDMIISQKTLQEMGVTKDFTIVSMIHQITLRGATAAALTNYIRQPIGYEYVRNHVANIGKTGIYGYAVYDVNHSNANNSHVINTILGDKNDYSIHITGNLSQGKFSVQGYINDDNNIVELSQVAWYWTFIAKGVLTTDEINQVIAYYNLDKYVKPDIYYNVKKQGLTNDTPDEDWYLKDFSGNGRDMTLYNYARTPESGINEEGGLQSDGVDDYGQFVGNLGLKDYTVVIDRAYQDENVNCVPFISSVGRTGGAPFLMEMVHPTSHVTYPYSFGTPTESVVLNSSRQISYQSTYVYNRNSIARGNSVKTGDGLTIGSNEGVSQYSKLCLWSFLLFPYSLSEFLLERQLKKHKLGTLYPGMVEFRPIISGRTDLIKEIKWYSDSWSKRIYVGDYIPKGVDVTANILLNDNTSELVKATYGNNYTEVRKQVNWSETNNEWDLIIHNIGKSPQKISITIDMYIRFEDIVQPYPVLLRFKDENNNEISWGDKIKLGSSITRIGSFNDCNLLKDIYTVSNAKLNGNPLPSTPHVVERQMVFTCTATWIFDDNEPNCILSPRLLRIPNSSYKILRHIPDISGHGNHGVIYNSAYAEGSGVNEDGSYQFDGVDDFVIISTLSKGGKQVLMKVNWQKQDTMLYDQNPGQDNFAIFTNDYNNNNLVVAYASRNNGNTYIDGVVNNNILATQLKGITHNIVATNNNIDATITPIIGSNKNHDNFFAQMSLYDFMLFDEISTDDKIKELNTYIGITPKVTLPNYYWDNYGKKNTDAKRGYIDEQVSLQKTGTSVNPLENFNISYEGMSGYNGYPVVFGANKTWETSNAVDYIYDINSTIVHITNVKHAAKGLLYSYVKRDGALANIKEIPAFRVTVKGLEENSKLIYKYLATENATKESIVYLGNGIHKLPKSFVPTDALLDLTTNSWIGFAITPMIEGELVFDCDITIEILPEYENGLVYDGVSDFTDNKNIPIFTDFTAIIKRVDLDAKNDNSTVMFKGNKIYESSIGNGFILDYCYNSKNYVYSYGKLNQIERDDSKIIYLTPESYNGNPIIKGENEDNLGLVLGKYWKGIIYKTILYSKTISLLEINFLKNLMEKDEIIDINHPIFISNTEDESNTSQDT